MAGPVQTMTKSQAILWKMTFWMPVGGFVAASVWFGWDMHQLFTRPAQAGLMCGNTVTDPLGALLSMLLHVYYPLYFLDVRLWHTSDKAYDGVYPINEVAREEIGKVYPAWNDSK